MRTQIVGNQPKKGFIYKNLPLHYCWLQPSAWNTLNVWPTFWCFDSTVLAHNWLSMGAERSRINLHSLPAAAVTVHLLDAYAHVNMRAHTSRLMHFPLRARLAHWFKPLSHWTIFLHAIKKKPLYLCVRASVRKWGAHGRLPTTLSLLCNLLTKVNSALGRAGLIDSGGKSLLPGDMRKQVRMQTNSGPHLPFAHI